MCDHYSLDLGVVMQKGQVCLYPEKQSPRPTWTGTPPVHQDELHMQPPPEKFVAFKAEANVVSCARQLRTGLYRSDLGWRGLGDWNQTSSTLGQRAPDGRIRWSNAFGPGH